MTDFGEHAAFDPPWDAANGDLAGPEISGDVTGIPDGSLDFGALEGARNGEGISPKITSEDSGFYEGDVWVPCVQSTFGITPDGLKIYRKPKSGDGQSPRFRGEAGRANLSSTGRMMVAAVGAVATIALVKHGVDAGWFAEQARAFGEEFDRWAKSPAGQ